MRVLYAIQGTGNGHLSRARDIIPALERKSIQLDILVSGTQADVQIPYPITYQLKGLSFIFGKKGGVDLWRTYLKANSMRLQKEINNLPIHKYDLIINDFEPVSAWACKLKNKACVSLSHQAAVLTPGVPQPKKKDPLGRIILENYAPASLKFGFHFKAYQERIFTPVIRKDVREATTSVGNYYTVYLPSYDDLKLIDLLSRIKNVNWQVFSKHYRKITINDNMKIMPVTNEAFVKSMAGCMGILCGAGFETPAEALYLKKKLMVIPMKGQYEQQCNMAALMDMGIPVLKSLKKKQLPLIREWIDSEMEIQVDYPDLTGQIIDQLFEEASQPDAQPTYWAPYV